MSTGFHNQSMLLSAFGGMQERIYCDHGHGADQLIKTAQDCAPVMDEVKQLRELTSEHPGETFTHVARFPIIFADKAMREGWFNDDAKWDQLLNDPDLAAFRVWQGRV